MILADSSFLVAFFHEKDSQHDKAIKDMKEYEEKKIDLMITEHILGETATVLLYYNGLNAAKTFLEYAEENFFVQHWELEDRLSTLKEFKNQQFKLSYIDASIVFLAKFLQMPVACYDENILKAIKYKNELLK
ncbi:MAG: PIN domain-containing protein [Candidatus Micrarchaeota archaeon]